VAASAKDQTLTPLELEIMQVLWTQGASTAAEVQPKLKGDLAYTTVQTMLTVLLKKEKVTREAEGRAHRYRAAVSRDRASGGALKDMVKRMFGGSPEALLMALVDTRQISAEQLTRIAETLNAQDPGNAKDKE
jgi:predicted transcriptional regulator